MVCTGLRRIKKCLEISLNASFHEKISTLIILTIPSSTILKQIIRDHIFMKTIESHEI